MKGSVQMKKDELLREIDNAKRIEEDAIASFTKHVDASIDWSGLSAKDQNTVHLILRQLAKDSIYHDGILDTIREEVLKGDKDVF